MKKKKSNNLKQIKMSETAIRILIAVLSGLIVFGLISLINCLTKQHPDTIIDVQQNNNSFVITATNKGEKIDRVKISISTLPELITDYSVRRGGNVYLIDGGIRATYAIFMIDELIPDTTQAITIFTKANKLNKLEAWSEYQGDLKKINKTPQTLEFGPEESFEEYQKK